ncbi:MAG: precorrin-3B C(17)-methyltransferase [Candidatus Calescibacterium sp.]|nr:precorrin-3B C(17)-methyltransferase [Candidatus Calescibacterium sp.]MDW8087104.1 precorrin-3B C(17)-methyltransferase [Candidatus Calescibacterium sp.]
MSGKLFVVGFGPGDEKNMTFWARDCIEKSNVVIGYETYIDLIRHLLDGKEVIETGMTEEIDRAKMAVEKAQSGNIVSIVSSGDAGIYGMAALIYEILLESGWRPGMNPDVEVVPGITSASACAALVGSPLSLDFAVVSMSDLLVPWELIEKRVRAAAAGDFVIVIYNPLSKKRTWQLQKTRDIIMEYRSPDTPVAVIKSAFREGQKIKVTTLKDMPNAENLGMLTTIIVGNSTTIYKNGIMLTPRGYSSKYTVPDFSSIIG